MSKFKYDVVTLIELVKDRPCLWDKTTDSFKDKIERQKAWMEVYTLLEKDFLRRSKLDQKKIGEIIYGKWQNVRDSFVKSLKKKSSGQPISRKYLYHNYLQFLMKVMQRDETEPNAPHQTADKQEEEQTEAVEETKATNNEHCNPRKKARLHEDIEREILMMLKNKKVAPDEDEAFFLSITPSVRRMSEEGKLEFRMGVLQLIKGINSRTKDAAVSETLFSQATSSTSNVSPYPAVKTDSAEYKQSYMFECE